LYANRPISLNLEDLTTSSSAEYAIVKKKLVTKPSLWDAA